MKLQLDTKEKTIKVEGKVNLNELFEALEKLLPQGVWKEFVLESNTEIVWSEPIYIPVYPYRNPYIYPWWQPTITYDTGIPPQLLEGTYCVQI